MMIFKNIRQFSFKNKKKEIEQITKVSAVKESKESIARGIPKYSWNLHCIRNKIDTVRKAPNPSIRKIVFGFNAS